MLSTTLTLYIYKVTHKQVVQTTLIVQSPCIYLYKFLSLHLHKEAHYEYYYQSRLIVKSFP